MKIVKEIWILGKWLTCMRVGQRALVFSWAWLLFGQRAWTASWWAAPPTWIPFPPSASFCRSASAFWRTCRPDSTWRPSLWTPACSVWAWESVRSRAHWSHTRNASPISPQCCKWTTSQCTWAVWDDWTHISLSCAVVMNCGFCMRSFNINKRICLINNFEKLSI